MLLTFLSNLHINCKTTDSLYTTRWRAPCLWRLCHFGCITLAQHFFCPAHSKVPLIVPADRTITNKVCVIVHLHIFVICKCYQVYYTYGVQSVQSQIEYRGLKILLWSIFQTVSTSGTWTKCNFGGSHLKMRRPLKINYCKQSEICGHVNEVAWPWSPLGYAPGVAAE